MTTTIESPNHSSENISGLISFFNHVKKKHGVNINDFNSTDEFIEELMKYVSTETLQLRLQDADGILDDEIQRELDRRNEV